MAEQTEQQRQQGQPEAVPAQGAVEDEAPKSLAEVVEGQGQHMDDRTEADELLDQRRQGSLQVTRQQAAAWQGELNLPDDALHPDDVAERDARVKQAQEEEQAQQRLQEEREKEAAERREREQQNQVGGA
jgi:hypothetical protein